MPDVPNEIVLVSTDVPAAMLAAAVDALLVEFVDVNALLDAVPAPAPPHPAKGIVTASAATALMETKNELEIGAITLIV